MIIDGKGIAKTIRAEIKEEISGLTSRPPCLAVVLVGEDAASKIYVGRKTKACEEVGILSIKRHLPASIAEDELLREVEQLNIDPKVDGILVQLPLPDHINSTKVTRWIDPKKDVDGFHPINMGKLLIGEQDGFVPCTPLGIKTMLDRINIDLEGKHAVIVGRSNIVGKPMAALLMQRRKGHNATVSIVHRYTPNPEEFYRTADILIVAIGIPGFITGKMVKKGAVVIDVGINRIKDSSNSKGYRVVGDVDFESTKEVCSHITPVPGGVGPMTIAMLLSNTLKSYLKRI